MSNPVRAKLIPDGPTTETFGPFVNPGAYGSQPITLPHAAIWYAVTVDWFDGCRVWFNDGTDAFLSAGGRWYPTGGDVGFDLDKWFPGVGL